MCLFSNTKFGIKEWNKSTQTFTVKTPKLPTTTEVTSGVPKTSFGSIGDYAIVARSNTSNKLYYKTRSKKMLEQRCFMCTDPEQKSENVVAIPLGCSKNAMLLL